VRHPEAAQVAPPQAELLAAAAALEAELAGIAAPPTAWPALPVDWNEDLPPEHLFGEYLQLIGSLLRELRPAELGEAELERVAQLAEPLIQFLHLLYKQQNPPPRKEAAQTATRSFYI
jgi:hypothetical protein